MKIFNPQSALVPKILATDLDGTLIPLDNNPSNRLALTKINDALRAHEFEIIFATGRQRASVEEAIRQYKLPIPKYLICDVGSSIYIPNENSFSLLEDYQQHLRELGGNINRSHILNEVIQMESIKPQEDHHQQEFKISFYCSTEETESSVDRINKWLASASIPYECMGSIDPFLNCGMLDLLPKGVSKAYALIWLSNYANLNTDEIVFAGDSGNDYAALTHGFKAIVVANARRELKDKVLKCLTEKQLSDHYYEATLEATSGVLEGWIHYQKALN